MITLFCKRADEKAMQLMKECTIMESLKRNAGQGMEEAPVERRSQCDGIQMMERKLAEGMPIIELLYKEAKQIHLGKGSKKNVPFSSLLLLRGGGSAEM